MSKTTDRRCGRGAWLRVVMGCATFAALMLAPSARAWPIPPTPVLNSSSSWGFLHQNDTMCLRGEVSLLTMHWTNVDTYSAWTNIRVTAACPTTPDGIGAPSLELQYGYPQGMLRTKLYFFYMDGLLPRVCDEGTWTLNADRQGANLSMTNLTRCPRGTFITVMAGLHVWDPAAATWQGGWISPGWVYRP